MLFRMSVARHICMACSAALVLFAWPSGLFAGKDLGGVDFARDIRPLLSDNCFACHGPDAKQRKADLRLDTREGALVDIDGTSAVVPGKPSESELVRRVTTDDEDSLMPPPDSGKKLDATQKALLQRWIAEGAEYELHWSYKAVTRPTPPRVKNDSFVLNDIDRFVLATLRARGHEPAREADRRTLIRRLSFDLTGLPPTWEQVRAFVADSSPRAFGKLVDRLLASPHYGERMAIYWLDLVRYADTMGYHSDNEQTKPLYREYVIDAFNDNLPFDQFTREQLAGDQLPDSTRRQLIASGYNRLNMTTREGGSQPKEYIAIYLGDRVRNVSGVWMATTLGCTECHDHKFDPFTSRDFYSLGAFFSDLEETPVGPQKYTPLPTTAQQANVDKLKKQIPVLEAMLNKQTPALDDALASWESTQAERIASEASAEADANGTEPAVIVGKPTADSAAPPKKIGEILAVPLAKRSAEQKKTLAAHYRTFAPELAVARKELVDLKERIKRLEKAFPTSLVSVRLGKPRTVRILPRGNWQDESGPEVQPTVPARLKLGDTESRAKRIDLADWVVSKDNPLTARVMVNRLWALCFGRGLAMPLDDFGAQGHAAHAPGVARLVGGRSHGSWLGYQAHDEAARHQRRVSAVLHRRRENFGRRSAQQMARAAGSLEARRGDGARQRTRRERVAGQADRRGQRQTVPAGGLLEAPQLPQAQMGARQRRQPVSARVVHVLVSHVFASEHVWPLTRRLGRAALPSAPAQIPRSRRSCCSTTRRTLRRRGCLPSAFCSTAVTRMGSDWRGHSSVFCPASQAPANAIFCCAWSGSVPRILPRELGRPRRPPPRASGLLPRRSSRNASPPGRRCPARF